MHRRRELVLVCFLCCWGWSVAKIFPRTRGRPVFVALGKDASSVHLTRWGRRTHRKALGFFLTNPRSVQIASSSAATDPSPDYVTICSAKDPKLNECMLNSGQRLLEIMKSGIPEFELPPIDPMMVPIVDFRKAGMGLTLVIKNSTHSGLGNLKFTKVSADPSNYHFEFHTVLPKHSILGTYSVDGKVMMLPIKGEGKTNITLHDVEGIWKLYGQPYMQNGTKYMKMKHFQVSVVPKLMAVHFENLFNGNKMLGDIMNEVLNSQWKDLYRYVKPALEKSHSEILEDFAQKFFSKIPYEELFLDL